MSKAKPFTVSATAAQAKLLSLDAVDPQFQVQNFLESRVVTAIANVRNSDKWDECLRAAIRDPGVDDEDDVDVILHALDTGILRTAAEEKAEAETMAAERAEAQKQQLAEAEGREVRTRAGETPTEAAIQA
ncbi:MAG: hypothetical protein AAF737_04715 [Pseudomonadota bacterium]